MILITILISLIFGVLTCINCKIAIALSIILCTASIFWILADKINIKKFTLAFIFIYPFLPCFAGFDLGQSLPVMRAHRILTLFMLLYLFRKGLIREFYTEFFKENIYTLPILFLILSMVITALVSGAMGSTFFFTISVIFEFIILTVLVFSVFKEFDDIYSLITAICASAIILSILGLFENFTSINIFSFLGAYRSEVSGALVHSVREDDIRILGPFDHAISFGAYFAMTLPLVLYKYKNNFFLLITLVMIFIGTILQTHSRAGLIGAGISLGYFFFFVEKKYRFLILLLISPILFSGGFWYRIQTLNPFFSGDEVLSNSSTARINQFNFLLDYIKQNIVFGFGMIDTPSMMRWIGNYHNTIDNYYLLYTFQYGVIGLITWIILIVSAIVKPIRLFGKKIKKNYLLRLLLISIFIFIIINTVVALWSFHFLFWIYLGIIARLVVNEKNEQQNSHNMS